MFGFDTKRTYDWAVKLTEVLEQVGIHPAERCRGRHFVPNAIFNACNVLLRQAEEIEAYREMVNEIEDDIASKDHEISALRQANEQLRRQLALAYRSDAPFTPQPNAGRSEPSAKWADGVAPID